MKKILLIQFVLTFCLISQVWAQTRTLTGKVSTPSGEPMAGVTVQLKGTTTASPTDANGNYSLTVPSQGGTLVFTFIGYLNREVVLGDQNTINVTMAEDSKQLSEVVVTAVGIERQKREVNYAVQDVKGEQLAQKSEPNVVNALQGKVAGVEIISSSGMPGSGSQIFIRGLSSATGNNQPLFVVDGVPISNNTTYSSNPTVGGASYSNRALDIHPNDIESMTVLKGPAAAALYGARASNGAIIITTKRGMAGDTEITVTSSYNLQEVYGLPKYQNEYGQGINGRYNSASTDSWGPRFGTPGLDSVPNVAGNPMTKLGYRAYEDNVKDFFQKGRIWDNGVTLSSGSEKMRYIFSVNTTNQEGIIPNSGLDRYTLRAAGNANLGHGFSVDGSVLYAKTNQEGSLQGNSGSSPWFTLPFIPRSFDISNVPYKLRAGVQAPTLFTELNRDNPMWSINESFYESEVNRSIVSATFNYNPEFFKDFTATYRVGLDQYSDDRLQAYGYGSYNSNGNTATNRRGSQLYDDIGFQSINHDLFGVYQKDITPDINVRALVGTQVNMVETRQNTIRAEDLVVPDYYNLANHLPTTTFTTNFLTERRLVGVYGQLGLNYKNWLFTEFTARNDWSSTLPTTNNSYFYPSVSVGFVFTDALGISNNILSYGKLRASYAMVGNDTNPYLTSTYYVTQSFGNNVAGLSFPFNGATLAFTRNDRRGNLNLKPENKKSYEIGAEFTFFDGRGTLDVNYFNNSTTDQILNLTVPGSTGFLTYTTNAGRIDNKGWEVAANVTPIQLESGFRWDVNANFTKLETEVVELAPGLDQFTLTTGYIEPTSGSSGSGFSGLSPLLQPGLPFGVLQGTTFRRTPAGQLIINPTNGLPVVDTNPQIIGDPNADWWGSLSNTFTFKGFSIGALVQYVHGGDFYSRQAQIARLRGVLEETAENREQPYMFEGVLANEAGEATTTPNNIQITAQQYWTHFNNASEFAVFDASVLRLREVTIGYTLPTTLLAKTPFKGINVSVTGRNLLFYAPNLRHADPESNQLGSNTRGFEFNSPPSVRNYGLNLRFTF
ncbi:SusC/RagA family TonB-linked outer membrane protein [Rufibacter hautae]|uniref:SusC/RagA family TonB-linked outer membrane protein n=1 Tax=Rufibacter hautae TaxID=2595005 RepID=A0A5B6TRV9_9BACT|nr:SusC/RagA family TonB-linked outer membrane protein [Rufibacter hautae]KAA3439258.1 SusC/RagA family TonB-linked outer membrane protein [Rufibacter hautae]